MRRLVVLGTVLGGIMARPLLAQRAIPWRVAVIERARDSTLTGLAGVQVEIRALGNARPVTRTTDSTGIASFDLRPASYERQVRFIGREPVLDTNTVVAAATPQDTVVLDRTPSCLGMCAPGIVALRKQEEVRRHARASEHEWACQRRGDEIADERRYWRLVVREGYADFGRLPRRERARVRHVTDRATCRIVAGGLAGLGILDTVTPLILRVGPYFLVRDGDMHLVLSQQFEIVTRFIVQ